MAALSETESVDDVGDERSSASGVRRIPTRSPRISAVKLVAPSEVVDFRGRAGEIFPELTDAGPSIAIPVASQDISFRKDVRNAEVSIQPSTIPVEQHMVVSSPIRPKGVPDRDLRYSREEGLWYRTVFPSSRPAGRQDVVLLEKWMDEQLSVLANKASDPFDLIKEVQALYTMAFQELVRQVSTHCAERGKLMSKLIKKWSALFRRVLELVQNDKFGGVTEAKAKFDKELNTVKAKYNTAVQRMQGDFDVELKSLLFSRQELTSENKKLDAVVSKQKEEIEQLKQALDSQRFQIAKLKASNTQLSDAFERIVREKTEIERRKSPEPIVHRPVAHRMTQTIESAFREQHRQGTPSPRREVETVVVIEQRAVESNAVAVQCDLLVPGGAAPTTETTDAAMNTDPVAFLEHYSDDERDMTGAPHGDLRAFYAELTTQAERHPAVWRTIEERKLREAEARGRILQDARSKDPALSRASSNVTSPAKETAPSDSGTQVAVTLQEKDAPVAEEASPVAEDADVSFESDEPQVTRRNQRAYNPLALNIRVDVIVKDDASHHARSALLDENDVLRAKEQLASAQSALQMAPSSHPVASLSDLNSALAGLKNRMEQIEDERKSWLTMQMALIEKKEIRKQEREAKKNKLKNLSTALIQFKRVESGGRLADDAGNSPTIASAIQRSSSAAFLRHSGSAPNLAEGPIVRPRVIGLVGVAVVSTQTEPEEGQMPPASLTARDQISLRQLEELESLSASERLGALLAVAFGDVAYSSLDAFLAAVLSSTPDARRAALDRVVVPVDAVPPELAVARERALRIDAEQRVGDLLYRIAKLEAQLAALLKWRDNAPGRVPTDEELRRISTAVTQLEQRLEAREIEVRAPALHPAVVPQAAVGDPVYATQDTYVRVEALLDRLGAATAALRGRGDDKAREDATQADKLTIELSSMRPDLTGAEVDAIHARLAQLEKDLGDRDVALHRQASRVKELEERAENVNEAEVDTREIAAELTRVTSKAAYQEKLMSRQQEQIEYLQSKLDALRAERAATIKKQIADVRASTPGKATAETTALLGQLQAEMTALESDARTEKHNIESLDDSITEANELMRPVSNASRQQSKESSEVDAASMRRYTSLSSLKEEEADDVDAEMDDVPIEGVPLSMVHSSSVGNLPPVQSPAIRLDLSVAVPTKSESMPVADASRRSLDVSVPVPPVTPRARAANLVAAQKATLSNLERYSRRRATRQTRSGPLSMVGLFEQMDRKYAGTSKPKAQRWVLKRIAEIYTDKIVADRNDDKARMPRMTLPTFVYEWHMHKYGLKALAEQSLHNFIVSVYEHQNHRRVNTFAGFIGLLNESSQDVYSLDGFNFYLLALVTLQQLSPSLAFDAAVVNVDVTVVEDAIDNLYPADSIPDAARTDVRTKVAALREGGAVPYVELDTTLSYLVTSWISLSEPANVALEHLFTAGDCNQDGALSFDEFRVIVANADQRIPVAEVKALYEKNSSPDGLTKDAFIALGRELNLASWRPGGDDFTVVAKSKQLARQLQEQWEKTEAPVLEQINILRSSISGTSLMESLDGRLTNLRRLLESRDKSPRAAWYAFQLLLSSLSEALKEHFRLTLSTQADRLHAGVTAR